MAMPLEQPVTPNQLSGTQATTNWKSCQGNQEDFSTLVTEVTSSIQKYCDHRPRVVVGTILAIGFLIGWKLKPW